MKSRTLRSIKFFYILLMLITILNMQQFELTNQGGRSIDQYSNSVYEHQYNIKLSYLDPIIILNDQDFDSYGFPGIGTEEEPYLIEYYTIETDLEFGIFITNVTKHFKIQFCTVNANVSAISISDLTIENIEISNNVCHGDEWYGIYIYSTNYVTISNNKCSGGAVGIVCYYSNHEIIKNNECYNSDFGIALSQTHNSIIEDNYCYSANNAGIHILGSNSVNATSNTVTSSWWGISFLSSSLGTISENSCENTNWGIYCQYSSLATIQKNYCTESHYGIRMAYTEEMTIQENTCNSSTSGIDIIADSASIIKNNYCYDNEYAGIDIHTSIATQVLNNTVIRNVDYGITIYKGTPSIVLNTCSDSNIGIRLREVDSLTIANNTCKNNQNGIILEETDFTTISYNILQENIEYGIKIWDWSTWNKIHHNYFICNNRNGTEHGFSQAYDEGYNNRWYESATDEGNYWNDYEGEGEYQIDGNHNRTDPYPFEYYYDCQVTSEPTTDPPEESSFGFFIVLLSFLGTVVIVKTRYNK